MDKERIRSLLQAVHSAAGEQDQIDLEDRTLLMQLHDDIETLLELSSEAPVTHREEVRTGLSGAIDRLEKNHPKLTRSIGPIAELLSGLGV